MGYLRDIFNSASALAAYMERQESVNRATIQTNGTQTEFNAVLNNAANISSGNHIPLQAVDYNTASLSQLMSLLGDAQENRETAHDERVSALNNLQNNQQNWVERNGSRYTEAQWNAAENWDGTGETPQVINDWLNNGGQEAGTRVTSAEAGYQAAVERELRLAAIVAEAKGENVSEAIRTRAETIREADGDGHDQAFRNEVTELVNGAETTILAESPQVRQARLTFQAAEAPLFENLDVNGTELKNLAAGQAAELGMDESAIRDMTEDQLVNLVLENLELFDGQHGRPDMASLADALGVDESRLTSYQPARQELETALENQMSSLEGQVLQNMASTLGIDVSGTSSPEDLASEIVGKLATLRDNPGELGTFMEGLDEGTRNVLAMILDVEPGELNKIPANLDDPDALARELGIEPGEAQTIIDNFDSQLRFALQFSAAGQEIFGGQGDASLLTQHLASIVMAESSGIQMSGADALLHGVTQQVTNDLDTARLNRMIGEVTPGRVDPRVENFSRYLDAMDNPGGGGTDGKVSIEDLRRIASGDYDQETIEERLPENGTLGELEETAQALLDDEELRWRLDVADDGGELEDRDYIISRDDVDRYIEEKGAEGVPVGGEIDPSELSAAERALWYEGNYADVALIRDLGIEFEDAQLPEAVTNFNRYFDAMDNPGGGGTDGKVSKEDLERIAQGDYDPSILERLPEGGTETELRATAQSLLNDETTRDALDIADDDGGNPDDLISRDDLNRYIAEKYKPAVSVSIDGGETRPLTAPERELLFEDTSKLATLLKAGFGLDGQTTGNEGGVRLTFNGEEITSVGEDGKLTITPEQLHELPGYQNLGANETEYLEQINGLLERANGGEGDAGSLVNLTDALWYLGNNTSDISTALNGSAAVRLESTGDQVSALMADGKKEEAVQLLARQMDAAATPGERATLWQEVGEAHFGPEFWQQEIRQLEEEHGDDPYYFGMELNEWAERYQEIIPPEAAPVILEAMLDELDMETFSQGGAMSTEPALANMMGGFITRIAQGGDQDLANLWAGRVVEWMSQPVETEWGETSFVPDVSTIEFLRDEGNVHLAKAFVDWIKDHPDTPLPYGAEASDYPEITQAELDRVTYQDELNARFEWFETNKDTFVPGYLDRITDRIRALPNGEQALSEEGVELGYGDDLRNLIAAGMDINLQNPHDLALNDPNRKDAEFNWALVNTIMNRMFDEAGIDESERETETIRVTVLPYVYAAERDGYSMSALFAVDGPDRIIGGRQQQTDTNEFVIDGMAMRNLVDEALEDQMAEAPEPNGTAGEPGSGEVVLVSETTGESILDEEALAGNIDIVSDQPWKYSSVRNFQDENALASNGRLYMSQEQGEAHGLDMGTFSTGDDGGIEVGMTTANLVTTGDKVMGWVDIGVGIVTAAATIGSFIPGVNVVAIPIAVAGGAYLGTRSGMRLADMHEHGMSLTTRQAWMEWGSIATAALPVGGAAFRGVGLYRNGLTWTQSMRAGLGGTWGGVQRFSRINRIKFTFGGKAYQPFRGTAYHTSAGAYMNTSMFRFRHGAGHNWLNRTSMTVNNSHLFTLARATDVGGIGVGIPLTTAGIQDLQHWGEMSLLDKANAIANLGSGVLGTGMGVRGLGRYYRSGAGAEPFVLYGPESDGPNAQLVPLDRNHPLLEQLAANPDLPADHPLQRLIADNRDGLPLQLQALIADNPSTVPSLLRTNPDALPQVLQLAQLAARTDVLAEHPLHDLMAANTDRLLRQVQTLIADNPDIVSSQIQSNQSVLPQLLALIPHNPEIAPILIQADPGTLPYVQALMASDPALAWTVVQSVAQTDPYLLYRLLPLEEPTQEATFDPPPSRFAVFSTGETVQERRVLAFDENWLPTLVYQDAGGQPSETSPLSHLVLSPEGGTALPIRAVDGGNGQMHLVLSPEGGTALPVRAVDGGNGQALFLYRSAQGQPHDQPGTLSHQGTVLSGDIPTVLSPQGSHAQGTGRQQQVAEAGQRPSMSRVAESIALPRSAIGSDALQEVVQPVKAVSDDTAGNSNGRQQGRLNDGDDRARWTLMLDEREALDAAVVDLNPANDLRRQRGLALAARPADGGPPLSGEELRGLIEPVFKTIASHIARFVPQGAPPSHDILSKIKIQANLGEKGEGLHGFTLYNEATGHVVEIQIREGASLNTLVHEMVHGLMDPRLFMMLRDRSRRADIDVPHADALEGVVEWATRSIMRELAGDAVAGQSSVYPEQVKMTRTALEWIREHFGDFPKVAFLDSPEGVLWYAILGHWASQDTLVTGFRMAKGQIRNTLVPSRNEGAADRPTSPRTEWTLAANLKDPVTQGGQTDIPRPISVAGQDALSNRIIDADDRILAEIASHRRPMMRTGGEAAYIVSDSRFEANYTSHRPHETPASIAAFAAIGPDGEVRAIFFRDSMRHWPVQDQQMVVGHELAHAYAHPRFKERATPLSLGSDNPHYNLHEAAAQWIAFKLFGPQSFASRKQGYQAYLASLADGTPKPHYADEMRVVERVVEEMGKDAFYRAYFQGDGEALETFVQLSESFVAADGEPGTGGRAGERSTLPTAAASLMAGGQPAAGRPFSGWPVIKPPAGQLGLFRSTHLPDLTRMSDYGALPPGHHVHLVRFTNPGATLTNGRVLRSGTVNALGQVQWRPAKRPVELDGNTHFVITELAKSDLEAQMASGTPPKYALYDGTGGWVAHQDIAGKQAAGTLSTLFPTVSAPPRWLPLPPTGEVRLYRAGDVAALEQASTKGALPPGHHAHVIRRTTPTLDHGQVLDSGTVNAHGQIDWRASAGSHVLDHNTHFLVTSLDAQALQTQMNSGTPPPYAVYEGPRGWIPHSEVADAHANGTLDAMFPAIPTPSQWQPTPQTPLSGAEARVFPTRLWPTVEARIFNGYFRSDSVLHVYVFAADNTPSAGHTVSFTPADIQAHGVLRPGAWEVDWKLGYQVHTARLARIRHGKNIRGQFGDPPPNKVWAFAVSRSPEADVIQAGGMVDIPWVLETDGIAGPVGGERYREPRISLGGTWMDQQTGGLSTEKFRSVRALRSISDKWREYRGMVWRPEQGWVPKDAPEPADAHRLPRWRIAQTGRAPIPMVDQAQSLAVLDIHNHPGTFSHPYYVNPAAYIARIRRASNRQGLINNAYADLLASGFAFTYEPVPYSTRRAGLWTGYTDLDTATVYADYAHYDDWNTLAHYEKLPPEERRLVIPSITGIEMFQAPTHYGHQVSPGQGAREQMARLLIWHHGTWDSSGTLTPTYVMAGELTVFAKELWRNFVGRRRNLGRPPLSKDVGDLAATHYATIRDVLDAVRDAGLVAELHNDASFMEFAVDGRPIATPGDSRYFFQLMKLLMELGPYDVSHLNFSNPDFTLSNADITRIRRAGPTKRPLSAVVAHFMVGNLTRSPSHHIELLQTAMTHELLPHLNFDASWLPSIEGTLFHEDHHHWGPHHHGRPLYDGPFVDLIDTGKVFYGGDVLNFQSFGQLAAPWYEQQPLLRALERQDPALLNWYAGDGARSLLEQSEPAQDWFRYRMHRDGGGDPGLHARLQSFVAKMPAERRASWDTWVSDYEARIHSRHGIDIRDQQQYQNFLSQYHPNTPDVPLGQQAPTPPQSPRPLPKRDDITIREPATQRAVHDLFADPQHPRRPQRPVDELTGRAQQPLVHTRPDIWQEQSPGPRGQQPSRQAIEAYALQPALSPNDLQSLLRPDGQPYSQEAVQAATDAAHVGVNRGLQLWTMAQVEAIVRSQEQVNAGIEARGVASAREIWTKSVANFAGLLAAGGLAIPLAPYVEVDFLPLILAGAVGVRGGVEIGSVISKEFNRKVSEAHNEQRAARPTWMEWAMNRFLRHGPKVEHGPGRRLGAERFRGSEEISIEELYRHEWMPVIEYLVAMEVDVNGGETQAMRHMAIQADQSLGVSQAGRRIGASQGAIEPFNYRIRSGRVFAWAASVGYGTGFVTAVADAIAHPGHIHSYAIALGTLLYAQHRAVAAISTRHGSDWTARPWPTRVMGIGANATLTLGSGLFAASQFADGRPLQGIFLSGAAYALYQFTRSAIRAEKAKKPPQLMGREELPWWRRKVWDPIIFPGDPTSPGVGKPSWNPKHRAILGAALISLAIVYFLEFLRRDRQQQQQAPGGPAVTPTTVSPTPTTQPTPSSSPSPTAPAGPSTGSSP